MKKGTVKFYSDAKSFGFITPQEGGADVFFHVSGISRGYSPQEDDDVSYDLVQGKKGKGMIASNVKRLS